MSMPITHLADYSATFAFASICTGCETPRPGRLMFDQRLKVIDSDGGMLFNDGWRCDECLEAKRLAGL